jgi:hypothetical protein
MQVLFGLLEDGLGLGEVVLAVCLGRRVPDEVMREDECEVQGDVDAGGAADEPTVHLHDLSVVVQEVGDLSAISHEGLEEVLGGVEDQFFEERVTGVDDFAELLLFEEEIEEDG